MATSAEETSHTGPSLDQVKSLLTCSICLDILNDPCTLSCFHSYCKSCLGSFVTTKRQKNVDQPSDEFNCPDCRSTFEVKPGEDVAEMKSSHFIRNLLEAYSLQGQSQVVKCSSCETSRPLRRCQACDVLLCSSCSKNHEELPETDLGLSHKVVPEPETMRPSTVTQHGAKSSNRDNLLCCNKHDKALRFYCDICKELICENCKASEHNDHSILSVEDAVKAKVIRLKSSLRSLEGNLQKGKQAAKAVSDSMQRLTVNLERAKEEVAQHKANVLEMFTHNLNQKAQEMVNCLDHEYNGVYEPLAKQDDEMKLFVEKVKVSVELAKSVLENATPNNVISLQEEIGQRVEILDKEKPKPLTPVHYGQIHYRSKPLPDPNFHSTFRNVGEVVCDPLISSLHTASEILKDEEELVEQMERWLNEQCRWRLCYRASKDGWTASKFHECCGTKVPTVTLVKVGDYIFGGYSDQTWEGNAYKKSTSSFLFSLRNKDNLSPFQAPIFQHYKYAICSHPNYGPSFGYAGSSYGCDLYLANNAHINQQSYTDLGYIYKAPEGYKHRREKTYSLLAGSYYFQPSEIEVFY